MDVSKRARPAEGAARAQETTHHPEAGSGGVGTERELGLSARWVRTLLKRRRREGDRALRHRLRGRPSNRKTPEAVKRRVVELFRQKQQAKLWHDYGPTLAAEELAEDYGIRVNRETLWQWLIEAKLWRARRSRIERAHIWRPRRARYGELVQWDTSEHNWLEGRGEKLYLISMIDGATSQLTARFVRHDSTEETLEQLRRYVEQHGRPVAVYTDKASLFQVAPRGIHHRDPERAALVRKGFELMAKGIHAADDVLRTVTALGLTTRKGRHVPKQTWHAILRNPIYAGWVKSGDLLVRGLHKPIVSQDLFDSVQDVLAGQSRTAQPRQRVHPGFPLRQFIRCSKCGKGLTAGVVKKKFPYYWCYTKGCRDVLVSTEELEKSFVRLLAMHQPTVELLEQLPAIAARQWKAREDRIRQESRALNIRLDEQRRLNSDAIKAKLKGELTEEDFDDVKQSIAEEITKIERELSALESEKSMMQELMEQSQKDMVDLVTAWRKANTSGKRELQIALFPDGLVWSHESGFLNSQNADLMQKIQTLVDSLEEDVKFGVPDGI